MLTCQLQYRPVLHHPLLHIFSALLCISPAFCTVSQFLLSCRLSLLEGFLNVIIMACSISILGRTQNVLFVSQRRHTFQKCSADPFLREIHCHKLACLPFLCMLHSINYLPVWLLLPIDDVLIH